MTALLNPIATMRTLLARDWIRAANVASVHLKTNPSDADACWEIQRIVAYQVTKNLRATDPVTIALRGPAAHLLTVWGLS